MLLLSSDSLPHYGLERFFEFAAKAKFDGVEITITTENYDTQNVEYLRKLEKRFEIPIRAFSMASKGEDKLMDPFHHTVRDFSGTTIILNPPKIMAFAYKNWVNDLIPRLAKKYDLNFCRRNTPTKNMFGIIPERSESSLMTLREAGDVCLDLTAMAISSEEIMRSISFLGNNLRHIYLSNVRRGIPYALPQNGLLPVESFLTKLAQVNYRGDFTLKVDPVQLREGDDEKVLESLASCRDFYDKYFLQKEENVKKNVAPADNI